MTKATGRFFFFASKLQVEFDAYHAFMHIGRSQCNRYVSIASYGKWQANKQETLCARVHAASL